MTEIKELRAQSTRTHHVYGITKLIKRAFRLPSLQLLRKTKGGDYRRAINHRVCSDRTNQQGRADVLHNSRRRGRVPLLTHSPNNQRGP
jgi:hypothetical protein